MSYFGNLMIDQNLDPDCDPDLDPSEYADIDADEEVDDINIMLNAVMQGQHAPTIGPSSKCVSVVTIPERVENLIVDLRALVEAGANQPHVSSLRQISAIMTGILAQWQRKQITGKTA